MKKMFTTLFWGIALLSVSMSLHAQTKSLSKQTAALRSTHKKYDPDRKAIPLKFGWEKSEVGIQLGSTTYLGDLQSKKVTWSQSNAYIGMLVRTPLHQYVTARAYLGVGQISADDAEAKDVEIQKRNLHFKSTIWELGIAGEFVLPLAKANSKGILANLTPYALAGLSIFHFNPKAQYQGKWVELKPLYTEGQRINNANAKSYRRLQLAIPIGVGFKYKLSPRMSVAAECTPRKTFTDYLDDVSTVYPDMDKLRATQGNLSAEMSFRGDEVPGRESKKATTGARRGSSDNSDWYMITSLGLRMKIGK
jgi:hypothetical protein